MLGIKQKKPKLEYTEAELYELALKDGKKRFGSPCDHKKTKGGRCLNCRRKVITKLP